MIVYYTHGYSGNKDESHELLKTAIAQYLNSAAGISYALTDRTPDSHAENPDSLAEALLLTLTTTGDFGKPVIPGFKPFSISHSRGTWAVLIADEECGLDIQYARKAKELNIARRVFAPEDADIISAFTRSDDVDDSAEACDISQAFFRIWARREALIKAAGMSVTDTSVPAVSSDQCMPVHYCGRDWYLRDIEIPDAQDLSAAVCMQEKAEPVRIAELHLEAKTTD